MDNLFKLAGRLVRCEDDCAHQPLRCEAARALRDIHYEVKQLRRWKADVENSTKIAMDERCTTNEQHRTCVPLLRAKIKRLQELLKAK